MIVLIVHRKVKIAMKKKKAPQRNSREDRLRTIHDTKRKKKETRKGDDITGTLYRTGEGKVP